MRIYLICPVRNRTQEQQLDLEEHVRILEEDQGYEVYFPGRDTGVREAPENATAITCCNMYRLRTADEVHVYYDPNSSGSIFDLGAAWILYKPILLVNEKEIAQMAKTGDPWALLLMERVGRSTLVWD